MNETRKERAAHPLWRYILHELAQGGPDDLTALLCGAVICDMKKREKGRTFATRPVTDRRDTKHVQKQRK
jgi:hypothetical protein